MEQYYYLKDTDVIQTGDEWKTDLSGTWKFCNSSVGYTTNQYIVLQGGSLDPGWKVRRRLHITPKGNQL